MSKRARSNHPKAVCLKLHGKPLELRPLRLSLRRVIAYLDKLPDDELQIIDELVLAVGIARSTLENRSRCPALADYRYVDGRIGYWGNPRAIAELRRQVALRESAVMGLLGVSK